jgi:hypothetical protein
VIRKLRYAIGSAAVLLAVIVFMSLSQGVSMEVSALNPDAVTRVEVVFQLRPELKPKEIVDSGEIAKVVAFVNAHRNGWQKPAFEAPISQVIAWFFVGERQERGFGVGSNFFWTQPNSTQAVSGEDRKTFLRALGLDETILKP